MVQSLNIFFNRIPFFLQNQGRIANIQSAFNSRFRLFILLYYLQYRRCCESCFQHLKGALLVDENVSWCLAKQLSAKEDYKSNSCEFHLVASGRMSISQFASVRHYLHCFKVDGDGEENQCGCKQCNGRVMCSPGQATPKYSCQGNADWRRNSVAVFTSLSQCHIQSTCTSQLLRSVFKAVFSCCLCRTLTLQGCQSKHGMVH